MNKLPIGIIDMNINNLSILNAIAQEFKYENFIYINDLQQFEYEGLTKEAINKRVKKNIDILLSLNIKLLVVMSNTIIEYCQSYLENLSVPVISIVELITEYVNYNYEHKNMVLLARKNIIEMNLYQQKLRFNHLYKLFSDDLDKIITDNKTKTAISFNVVKETLNPILKKDIDVIIPTTSNLLLLRTEINEYLPFVNIINVQKLVCARIAKVISNNAYYKKRGKIYLYINVSKKEFVFKHLLKRNYIIKRLK